MRKVFPPFLSGAPAVGLLLLRLFMGMAFMMHGWGKVQSPHGPAGWMGPDAPIHPLLQGLATLAEFGGGLALILGLLTPLAALGILITMLVASLSMMQRGAPFLLGKGFAWEPTAMYFMTALMLILTGPGAFSLDARLFGRAPERTPKAAPNLK